MLVFNRPVVVFVVFTLLALLFPVFSIVEKFYANTLSLVFYYIASLWLGIIFIAFSACVLYEPIRLLFRTDSPKAALILASVIVIASIAAAVNAQIIKVVSVEIPVKNLETSVRIVQLSDIHVGTIRNTGYLERIVRRVNQLQPDMVLITGDFFDGTGPVKQETIMPLSTISAKTFFTLGNHERYDDVPVIEQMMHHAGVRVLRNEAVRYKGLQIVGVDHPEREGQKGNKALHAIELDHEIPSVLMYHTPSGIDDALKAGIDLQLSGHTHNGQIVPFNYLTKLFYPYIKGLYSFESMYLYVSQGTGTWGPPMRIGSSNEITNITLKPAS